MESPELKLWGYRNAEATFNALRINYLYAALKARRSMPLTFLIPIYEIDIYIDTSQENHKICVPAES
jgi:hypothetical protein